MKPIRPAADVNRQPGSGGEPLAAGEPQMTERPRVSERAQATERAGLSGPSDGTRIDEAGIESGPFDPGLGIEPLGGGSIEQSAIEDIDPLGGVEVEVVPRVDPGPPPARFDEVTDEDLMDYCVFGYERAFVEITRRYKTRIINLVYRFIRDHQRAEDLSQEVFVRVYLHRERYRKSGKFSTWIFTIAVNLAKNEIRRKVRLRNVLSLEGLQEVAGNAGFFLKDRKARPDRDIERDQLNEIVQRSIEKLPARYRMALVLRDIEGLPYEEIGEILQIPGGTVRSRINRARLMLKEKLKPYVRSGL